MKKWKGKQNSLLFVYFTVWISKFHLGFEITVCSPVVILFWRRWPEVLVSCRVASQWWGRLRWEWETEQRQQEMAEGKEERTGSGATLDSKLRWPSSSGAVSDEEHHPARARTLHDRARFYLLIRGTSIDQPIPSLWDYWTAPESRLERFGSGTAEREYGAASASIIFMAMSCMMRSADRVLTLTVSPWGHDL